jgi:predicted HTH domain antitoxin
MEITVKLPDDLAQHQNPGREALEALVLEGYRSGAFSDYQAAQMLGLARLQFDGFLKSRGVTEHAYDVEDLQQDMKTLRELESKFPQQR